MLTKNNLFKIFVVVVCFMEAQVHSAAMENHFARRRVSRSELQRVVDSGLCLTGLSRRSSLVETYKVLTERVEKRLALVEVLNSVEREKLISDTLSLTKMVAWLKVSGDHKIDTYDYCIKLIKTIRPEAENKRDSTLLNANLARILYFKLNNDRRDVSHSDFDTDQRRRKEIYNLYHKAIENGASKIVLLKAAELIMKHDYSPTGDKVQDLVIAEEMLTGFFNPKSVRGNGLAGGMLFSSAQKSDSDVNRDRRNSLPFAGSSRVRDEAIRLLSLVRGTKEEHAEEGVSSPVSLSALPVSLSLGAGHSPGCSAQIEIEVDPNPLSVGRDLPLAVPLAISGGSVSISGSSGGTIAAASPVPLSFATFLPSLLPNVGTQVEDAGTGIVTEPALHSGSGLVGDSPAAASVAATVEEEDTGLIPTPTKKKKRRIIDYSEGEDGVVACGKDEDITHGGGSDVGNSDSTDESDGHKSKKVKKLSERKLIKLVRRLGSTYGKQPR